jgi:hypothetical protein
MPAFVPASPEDARKNAGRPEARSDRASACQTDDGIKY